MTSLTITDRRNRLGEDTIDCQKPRPHPGIMSFNGTENTRKMLAHLQFRLQQQGVSTGFKPTEAIDGTMSLNTSEGPASCLSHRSLTLFLSSIGCPILATLGVVSIYSLPCTVVHLGPTAHTARTARGGSPIGTAWTPHSAEGRKQNPGHTAFFPAPCTVRSGITSHVFLFLPRQARPNLLNTNSSSRWIIL